MNRLAGVPRLLRLLGVLTVASVVALVALRVGFWWWFRSPDNPLPAGALAWALYLGAKYDLRLVLLLLAPLALLGAVPRLDPLRSVRARRGWLAYLTLALHGTLLAYFVDFGYYAYLGNRLDATVLRFLADPAISVRMLWQSYPIVWLTLGLFAVTACGWWALRGLLARVAAARTAPLSRGRLGLVIGLAVVAYAAGLYGKLSYYPLRWSDAFDSPRSFGSHLALNPVLFLANTLKNRDRGYDAADVQDRAVVIAPFLGVPVEDARGLSFARTITPAEPATRRPNVVVVLLESFAYYKLGVSGNPLSPTPHFDALARDGLLFRRFHASHGGTARAVWSIFTGLPDVEPIKTSSRNPLLVRQHVVVNALEDYDKLYFLGGSASWGQIRGLLAHNIPGLSIFEEGRYGDAERVDVWGISDLELFRQANRELSRRTRPFFAFIHTAGNHKPYTIPDDNAGFLSVADPAHDVTRHGFRSVESFNAFRFLDHCVGEFMRLAREAPYFDETVFVFLADHGLARSAAHMHRSEEALELTRYHIPLVVYGPAVLGAPRVIDAVGSQADLLPTLAGLLRVPYLNTTLGRDLLDPRHDGQRFAFTIRHSEGPDLGIIGPSYYYRMHADGSNPRLHAIGTGDPEQNQVTSRPEIARRMQALCRAYYATARYIRHFNAPPDARTRR